MKIFTKNILISIPVIIISILLFALTISYSIALISYSIAVGGFVFYKFYYWFILPVFTSLPEITYLSAIGLSISTYLLKGLHVNSVKIEYTDFKFWHRILIPWIILGTGWLFKIIFL